MTYVVTEKCVDCKFTSCVSVCPVDAFHETPDRLYINPETCIDCNACMDECPVEAVWLGSVISSQYQRKLNILRRHDYVRLRLGHPRSGIEGCHI